MRKNPYAVLSVLLALAGLPLACGDDEESPEGGDGASGSGANATGGSGAAAGEATGGSSAARGGNTTGGTSGAGATGGSATGGRGGTTGGSSGATGDGGAAGATDGGSGGAGADAGAGGEGGEGSVDEELERLKRICKKAEPLGCDDHSHCIEDFRWMFFAYPDCRESSDAMLSCLDLNATTEDFACWFGRPTWGGGMDGPCQTEFDAANDRGCLG